MRRAKRRRRRGGAKREPDRVKPQEKRAERSEGADGVARSASPRGQSFNRRSAKRFGRTDHPGASRHPSSARRGIAVRRLS